ncbi:MAG: peptidylprolyl isomerase [Alphaproteobacteria bacterium]|nr:peptidylprolyl isomerase [Alphaproteobacteria bacterium]
MSKMLRVATLALALGALALPVVAADKESSADAVVARVNGDTITRADIAHEMQAMGSRAAQLPMQVLYPQLLEKAIMTKLVSAKGYEDKLQNDKDVKARLKDIEAQLVADAYVRKEVTPQITDAKLKARYDELSAKFKPEDEVRARHILVKTEAEANELLKQVKGGTDFAKLATEKTMDTGSAKQGGDLGYFPRTAMVKPFAEAAFAMKVGEISDKPVKTDFGYHIIKLEDRRKSSPPPMAEVKDELTAQVGQEIAAKMIKDMEAKAKIERFNLDGTPMTAKADKKADEKK